MSQTVPGTGIKQQGGDPSEDDGKPGSPHYLVADSRDVDTWNVIGDGEETRSRKVLRLQSGKGSVFTVLLMVGRRRHLQQELRGIDCPYGQNQHGLGS